MKYIKSVNEFNEEIKNGKILVDFYADWCPPCKMIGEVLEEIENELEGIEIIKVNTDNLMQLARDFKVLSIPALKIFENGKLIKEKDGFMTRSELLEFINK